MPATMQLGNGQLAHCPSRRPSIHGRGSLQIHASGVSMSPINRKAQRAQRAQRAALLQQQKKEQERNEALQQREEQQQQSAINSTSPTGPSASSSLLSTPPASYEILEAFFYGRAFAITLSKRLGEVIVDTVAEISKAAAERPQRIQEFQEEVAQLARQEMAAASLPVRSETVAPATNTSAPMTPAGNSGARGGPAAANSTSSPPQDVEALVDNLRAEIAVTRSVLQSIKTGGKSGAPPQLPADLDLNRTSKE